ncbi:hypothetical protein FRC00_001196, partial [Tulasnella sp. 408]
MDDAEKAPVRQVPQLKLQLDLSPSPTPSSGPRNPSSSMLANALLSPMLDQKSPIVQALATTAPKDKEFRKLLGLLLANLRNRRRPPPVYDDFRTGTGRKHSGRVGSAFNAIKGAVQIGKRPSEGSRSSRIDGPDSDDDEAGDDQYSTDDSVDHLTQLRDVLIMSERLGWNILSGLRRSQSKERRGPKNDDILDECIDLLEELISEDCRYRVKKVHLTKPPNALQSVCLDFAQCLLINQRRNPKMIADIGFAVIPAFTTFPPEMHARLIRFFEENVLRGMLDDLAIDRAIERPDEASPPRRHQRTETPIVAIQVDEPSERRDSKGWIQWTPVPSPSNTASNIVSTNAPGQSLRIYQLSSLVSPLLAAVLESVDWLSAETPIDVVHRVHRLLEFIADCKPDAYLDLLEIVAYHTEPVRHAALSVMLSFWPHAVGHAYVGRAFPIVSYTTEVALRESRRSRIPVDECAYAHQFMAWGFSTSQPGSASLSLSPNPEHQAGFTSPDQCQGCGQVIEGFGLICTICLCAVHIQCYDYPDGQFFAMYPSPHDARMQKVALTRFSHVLPNRRSLTPPVTRRDKHTFRLVNLFTLTLCMVCKLPLWGCAAQALECSGCKQFVHPGCVSTSSLPTCRVATLSSSTFTIEWNTLRKSFMDEYQAILFEEEELSKCSYEEISVAYGVLWTQLQILRQGIASGSVLAVEKRSSTSSLKETAVDEWDIQGILKLYESFLQAESHPKSDTLEEYKSMARMHIRPSDATSQLSFIFEWPLLVYATAILKSPRKAPANSSQTAAATFLSVNLNEDNPASAEDLEHPFELVVLSHMRDTLGFEFNDDRLVRVARDYVARGEPLPGVRLPMEGATWPAQAAINHTGMNKTSSRSGNDYLACRRELLVKYAARWLLALYNQDPQLYASALYDQAVELAIDYDNRYAVEYLSTPIVKDELFFAQKRVDEADYALKTLLKLSQCDVLFSTFDTVMSIWLDEVAQLAPQGQVLPFPSLRRLAGKDAQTRRASISAGTDGSTTNDTSPLDSDPWHIITDLAITGLDGLARAIRWLRVAAHSSVPIPLGTLSQVSTAVKASSLTFLDHLHLCEIIFCVAWVEPLGRHDMIATLASLNIRHMDWMISRYRKSENRESILQFLRYSFAACLLLYGCERRLIVSLGLVDGAYADSLVVARAQNVDQLFQLILILNDLSLLGEGSRGIVTPIFTAFLRAIWADPKDGQVSGILGTPVHGSNQPVVLSWKVVLEGVASTIIQVPEEKSQDAQAELRASRFLNKVPQVALLALSLQLVGNGVPTDIEVLLIIKTHVAQALGFPSAQLTPGAEGGRHVRLGPFHGLPKAYSVLLSGLVKALDSTTTAPLPPSAMTNTSSEDTRKDPYVGAVFIDLALMLAITADFASLPYLSSRAILDGLLISIYKYDITRPALAHLNEQILNAIGKITHTVNMEISYDLRSAALTIAQAFLKKWPEIVIKILSVQMMMCDLKLAKDNLLVAQGTSFLESAFAQFAMNGLFVLLLKYPLQEDFFKTVKHVMQAHAKNRPAGQSLRETVFSDTFRRLAERPDDSPDPILPNLKAFVELVYCEGYSTDLMHDTHSPAFNPNPWLDMCVIIIRNNKQSCSELLGTLENFLKAAIHRFDVVAGTLTDLILQTAPFYRRTDPRDLTPYPGSIVVEVVSEGLRGKARLPPATLASALTALKDVFAMHQTALPAGTLNRMAAECAYYLCTPLRSESYVEASFTVTMIAADLVLEATKVDADVPRKFFIESNERIGKMPPTVRSWNALLLSALLSPNTASTTNLFSNLRSFTPIYTNSLAFLVNFEATNKSDSAALDLDQAFTAIKLWMMLSRRKPPKGTFDQEEDVVLNRGMDLGAEEAVQDNRDRTVWNELWPAFENVLSASAAEGSDELTPLTLAIWSSFAELVIFLHLLRSPIALETSAVHMTMLKNLRKRIKNESASSKITRALKCVAEPPTALPLDLLVAQARTELLAGEKLAFAFEKRKLGNDRRPERRKEHRT